MNFSIIQKSYTKKLLFLFSVCVTTASCQGSCASASNQTPSNLSLKFEQLNYKCYEFNSTPDKINAAVIFEIKNSGANPADKLELSYKNISQDTDAQTVLLNNKQEDTIILSKLVANASTGQQTLKVHFSKSTYSRPIIFKFDILSNGQTIHTQHLEFKQSPLSLIPLSELILAGDQQKVFKFKIKKQESSLLIDIQKIKFDIANRFQATLEFNNISTGNKDYPKLLGNELIKNGDLEQPITLKITPNSSSDRVPVYLGLQYDEQQLDSIQLEWFKDPSDALHQAVEVGNIVLVQTLIGQKVNLEKGNYFGYPPLHIAVIQGSKNPNYPTKEMIKLLLDAGANVNSKDSGKGNTPLHWACENNGNLEALKILVANSRIQLNEKNIHNERVLHVAAKNNHKELVEELLKTKIITDYTDNSNKTAADLTTDPTIKKLLSKK